MLTWQLVTVLASVILTTASSTVAILLGTTVREMKGHEQRIRLVETAVTTNTATLAFLREHLSSMEKKLDRLLEKG